MTYKIAINGYGRIGRNILRAFYESKKIIILKSSLSMMWEISILMLI